MYLVFDVESAGLYGDAFAFGYVVVDEYGAEKHSGELSSGIGSVECGPEAEKWLRSVLPADVLRGSMFRIDFLDAVLDVFNMAARNGWKLVADCGYPAETRLLHELEITAYPLLDVSTALMMVGKDPIGIYDRLPSELPKHSPLADARQSARIWIECLKFPLGGCL